MSYNLDNKVFKVIKSDGPGASVTEETLFYFKQEQDIVLVEYRGGGIKFGKQLGIMQGDIIKFKHMQITMSGAFENGESIDTISVVAGKIQLSEKWEWKSDNKSGTGILILEEM